MKRTLVTLCAVLLAFQVLGAGLRVSYTGPLEITRAYAQQDPQPTPAPKPALSPSPNQPNSVEPPVQTPDTEELRRYWLRVLVAAAEAIIRIAFSEPPSPPPPDPGCQPPAQCATAPPTPKPLFEYIPCSDDPDPWEPHC